MSDLSGTHAIVTGAGQGVGRGIALALAKAGANVAVVGRTLEKCQNTVAEIEAAGGRAIALSCDVGHRDEVESTVQQVFQLFGSIHILVNNAHTSRPLVSMVDTSDRDLAIAFKGYYGAVYMMQACYPHLQASRGSVINLGSVAGLRGDHGMMAYASAKEALRAMSRTAAREWGPQGIRVNVVCPFSESPGVQYMIDTHPGFIDELTEQTALKQLGRSEQDVGATVVFLCSDGGRFMTGQTLHVDGGIWIAP